jgi:hypothetical protein
MVGICFLTAGLELQALQCRHLPLDEVFFLAGESFCEWISMGHREQVAYHLHFPCFFATLDNFRPQSAHPHYFRGHGFNSSLDYDTLSTLLGCPFARSSLSPTASQAKLPPRSAEVHSSGRDNKLVKVILGWASIVRKKEKAKEKELVQDVDWDIVNFSEWGG